MKIPDRIFITEKTAKIEGFRYKEGTIEYIRKDALLEWAKDMHEAYRKKYEESNHTCGEHWGQMVAFRKMINKLNSL